MDLQTKKKIAHLESQNAMALECIQQIKGHIEESYAGHCAETLDSINDSIKWFNKYGK